MYLKDAIESYNVECFVLNLGILTDLSFRELSGTICKYG